MNYRGRKRYEEGCLTEEGEGDKKLYLLIKGEGDKKMKEIQRKKEIRRRRRYRGRRDTKKKEIQRKKELLGFKCNVKLEFSRC
ncbi:hypothetical protein F2Q70_00009242 [Brassica cretica]|uniref:Uncharacterized protein n=1 Tax=Brassica cretica TaxID=69181 RepID=A0A8S9LV37_BRACR|nr:hypothetical protein F2Q70_00009242 [Brassica cretica]